MVTALVVFIILFVVCLLGNILWMWFMYSYARDWPNEKDDFDRHMTDAYEKIKAAKDKKKKKDE